MLEQVELEALEEGKVRLVTEASLLSYRLLLLRGWKLIDTEKIEIGGVGFERYLMEKLIQ